MEQPPVAVNMNVAVPALTALTSPVLLTVATAPFVLAHVPPVVGDSCVVAPIQIKLAPVMFTVGLLITVIGDVGAEVQPVKVDVKVKVTVPTPTPVTRPLFATVAIPLLLLCHVPPVVGDNWDVKPTQMVLRPVIDTVGLSVTVTSTVFVQPVPVSVNCKVATPTATPVTTPPGVTVANPMFKLNHVPADEAETFIVEPIQTFVFGAMMVGLGFIFNNDVVLEHPVALFVKVKDTLPCATAVISPVVLSIVATPKLLLIHFPVTDGVTIAFAVPPTHVTGDDKLTTGLATTTTGAEGADEQPVVVSVQINVADPGVKPVTIPELLITATVGFDVDHVPPELGKS